MKSSSSNSSKKNTQINFSLFSLIFLESNWMFNVLDFDARIKNVSSIVILNWVELFVVHMLIKKLKTNYEINGMRECGSLSVYAWYLNELTMRISCWFAYFGIISAFDFLLLPFIFTSFACNSHCCPVFQSYFECYGISRYSTHLNTHTHTPNTRTDRHTMSRLH